MLDEKQVDSWTSSSRLSLWSRPLLVAGGFLIALPEWKTTIIGAALTALVIAIILILKKTSTQKLVTGNQQ